MSQVGLGFRVVARRRLRALGSFGAVGGLLSAGYAITNVGLPCPFRAVTGWLCPLCGSTHLGVELLRGNLPAAWAANQLVFLAAFGLGAYALLLLVSLASDGAARRLQLLEAKAARLPSGLSWASIAALALGFALWRNLA